MKWKIPNKIKVYEALGSIADSRIKLNGNSAQVFSSSGNKNYTVTFDPGINAITSNDNGSYWQGYLGYPSIAVLMAKGLIKYNNDFAEALKGIHWKDINTKFKNDFDKTTDYIHDLLQDKKIDLKLFKAEVDAILSQISKLKMNKLGTTAKPPQGY